MQSHQLQTHLSVASAPSARGSSLPASASPPSPAPDWPPARRPPHAPSSIAGDPHSPHVAGLAKWPSTPRTAFEQSDARADHSAYVAALEETATATASEMGVSRLQMTSAWLATDDAHQTALLTALTQLGVEYRSATSEPGVGFDCSGLMFYAWSEAGFQLTRQSGAQISEADAREMARRRPATSPSTRAT